MTPPLEVAGLRHSYGEETVLDGISFQVAAGEAVGLAGANGSGKSTLLWRLAGLLQGPGQVVVRARIGMVFQNPEDQLFMPTLLQDLALPLLNAGVDRAEAAAQAAERLREFGLERMADRPAGHLSLGQRKRAAVALALIRKPEILLMDEPTAELDGRAVRRLVDTLRALDVARLVASHDLDFLRAVTSRTIVLAGGRIAADGPTDALLSDDALLRRAELL